MRTTADQLRRRVFGFTLIEAMVFIVVVGIGLATLLSVFSHNVTNSVDPVVRTKALEKAQALMDDILARKFDESTPSGGIPACDSSAGANCLGIVADSDYDDVGDFNTYTDNSEANFGLSVDVVLAGADLGLANSQAKKITVTANFPGGGELQLTSYKVNF